MLLSEQHFFMFTLKIVTVL